MGRSFAELQASELTRVMGVPAASTSLAFAEACQQMRFANVAVLWRPIQSPPRDSSYPFSASTTSRQSACAASARRAGGTLSASTKNSSARIQRPRRAGHRCNSRSRHGVAEPALPRTAGGAPSPSGSDRECGNGLARGANRRRHAARTHFGRLLAGALVVSKTSSAVSSFRREHEIDRQDNRVRIEGSPARGGGPCGGRPASRAGRPETARS